MTRYVQQEIDLATVLHTSLNMSQAQIAKELSWTTSKVCRVLKTAREEQGLWREEVVRTIVSDDLAERADSILAEHEGEIWKKFKPLVEWMKQLAPEGTLREVHIFRSERKPLRHERAGDHSVWDRAALEFGRRAAPLIQQRLIKAEKCGVSWGRTLRAIVMELQKQTKPWPDSETQFFPLWGEVPAKAEIGSAVFTNPSDLGSTQLAEDLYELVGASKSDFVVPDLRAALAMMPASFAKNDSEVIRSLMMKNPNYNAVMTEFTGEMDAALLGVGSFEQHGRALSESVLKYYGKEGKNKISQAFSGDIGGVLMPREDSGLLKDDTDKILKAWLGVRREHLEKCAKKTVGTLVCAVGKERADTLIKGIRDDLCTEIFMDDNLAKELEKKRREFFKA